MNSNTNFSNQIMQFINSILFLEKRNVFTHKGITLHPSEIHLLQIIAQGQNTNATMMAEKLGITKGAVSQTLSRLEKKNVLIKTKDPFNKNELTILFTKTGEDILHQFAKKREPYLQNYESYLSGLSKSDKEVINKFLFQMQKFLSGL